MPSFGITENLCADFDLNLSREIHVGLLVRILDESANLPSRIAEEENRRLIAICTPLLCRSEPENLSRGGIGSWKLTNDTIEGFSQPRKSIALDSILRPKLTEAIQCDFVRSILRNPVGFGKLSTVGRSEILDALLPLPNYNAG